MPNSITRYVCDHGRDAESCNACDDIDVVPLPGDTLSVKRHGGARTGAGRKPMDGRRVTVLATPTQVANLETYAASVGLNRSAALRHVLEHLRPNANKAKEST